MKVLTHNIQQEREDQRDRSAQLFMWCIVVSMHQDDGIGASRLLRACNEMDAFEKKYQTAILYGSSKNATDAMRENLKGICDFEVRLPVDRAPRGRREEQLRMASNQGAEIAWLGRHLSRDVRLRERPAGAPQAELHEQLQAVPRVGKRG